MIGKVILFASSLVAVQGTLGPVDVRKLKPDDAGAYHTEGFEMLAERYETREPSSQLELIVDASEIAASFCPIGDRYCVNNAYKATLEQFRSGGKPAGIKYPEGFNKDIIESLDEAFSVVENSDGEDIDSLVNDLVQIQDRIEDMENVNTNEQVTGLASLSVAIESAKLWHSVYHDEEHPLSKMIGQSEDDRGLKQRNLQNGVLAADFEAAVNAAINAIDQDITVLAVWPDIILKIIPNAYAASINAAFEEPSYGFYPRPPKPFYGYHD